MKRLLSVAYGFDTDVYEVPYGVETICDMAFTSVEKPLLLVVPPTVKVIGSDLFRSDLGGRIVVKR